MDCLPTSPPPRADSVDPFIYPKNQGFRGPQNKSLLIRRCSYQNYVPRPLNKGKVADLTRRGDKEDRVNRYSVQFVFIVINDIIDFVWTRILTL